MDVGTQLNKIGGIPKDEFDKQEDYDVIFLPFDLTIREYKKRYFDGNVHEHVYKRELVDRNGVIVDITELEL